MGDQPNRKPPAVTPGCTIALVSPASHPRPERIARAIAFLEQQGYKVKRGEHLLSKARPYFAGTAEQRLQDLHAAFQDDEVAAILCSRGGYGSNYLLAGLDLELIRRNPKPLIGYSDLTALQTWLLDQVGLPGFYGPMLSADFAADNGVDLESFRAVLAGERACYGPAHGLRVLRKGTAKGTLYGGCLSILTAAMGTHYAPHTEGKLLFLEDVAAKPYQVDRMLRQMLLGGKLDGVTGVIFGEMLDCVSPGADPGLLDEVILQVLRSIEGPIAIGLRAGHVSHGNVTLPLGVTAELNLEGEPMLQLLEPAVNRKH
ncbi:MAG TPA: LD-carboxypeptidase [Acidisarcina sp.]|nr:LD-carboxypeptidase [Acidisarcina sp.]